MLEKLFFIYIECVDNNNILTPLPVFGMKMGFVN